MSPWILLIGDAEEEARIATLLRATVDVVRAADLDEASVMLDARPEGLWWAVLDMQCCPRQLARLRAMLPSGASLVALAPGDVPEMQAMQRQLGADVLVMSRSTPEDSASQIKRRAHRRVLRECEPRIRAMRHRLEAVYGD
jgi:hypothetical protein